MNPSWARNGQGWSDPQRREEIQRVVASGGGIVLDPGEIPGLNPSLYLDDVHLNEAGKTVVSAALGATLAKWLPAGEASALPAGGP